MTAGSNQSERSPDGFLGAEAIEELDRLYLDAFLLMGQLKAQSPATGLHLTTPKLPTALSEGLAAVAVPKLFGASFSASRPTGLDDMELRPDRRIVAVKGTGASRWISITRTDLRADALVWVDYSRRLVGSARTVDIWLFEEEVERWATRNRLTFRQAAMALGRDPKLCRFSLRRLGGTA